LPAGRHPGFFWIADLGGGIIAALLVNVEGANDFEIGLAWKAVA